jgi:hypothetical protein
MLVTGNKILCNLWCELSLKTTQVIPPQSSKLSLFWCWRLQTPEACAKFSNQFRVLVLFWLTLPLGEWYSIWDFSIAIVQF